MFVFLLNKRNVTSRNGDIDLSIPRTNIRSIERQRQFDLWILTEL